MEDNNKLVPKNQFEIVVPVGKANLITTREEIDEALEIASRIFSTINEETEMELNDLATELDVEVETDANGNEFITTPDNNTEVLVKLNEEELASLPHTRYGRDVYGRTLNKDGTVRKGRTDKGRKRGTYNSKKSNITDTVLL